ncbi:MAG TPA: hypothetical protein ENG59_02970 [Chloroflexi bacterium]|nr:hypothetical protein [Chloroflexota bacterium]
MNQFLDNPRNGWGSHLEIFGQVSKSRPVKQAGLDLTDGLNGYNQEGFAAFDRNILSESSWLGGFRQIFYRSISPCPTARIMSP